MVDVFGLQKLDKVLKLGSIYYMRKFEYWKFCPPPQNLLKSSFPDKIFDNSVFLISSRDQTSLVHTNSTRRIFLDRSQGFQTSFWGVTGKWKSYFENYKKKGARRPAPDQWILCKIGRGIVWEGSWTPKTENKLGKFQKIRNSVKLPKSNFSNFL